MHQPQLKKHELNLVWLDCEMTGLNPEHDRLLELAIVVTDANLLVRIESPVWVLHQDEAILSQMDKWNQSTHSKSGLLEKVRHSELGEAQAENEALDFLSSYLPKGSSPLCGNTIGQDRRFLARYMPKLEAFFHYRNLDVSTLKELARRWNPKVYAGFKKRQKHTALADVHESIDELCYYRKHFLAPIPPENGATQNADSSK